MTDVNGAPRHLHIVRWRNDSLASSWAVGRTDSGTIGPEVVTVNSESSERAADRGVPMPGVVHNGRRGRAVVRGAGTDNAYRNRAADPEVATGVAFINRAAAREVETERAAIMRRDNSTEQSRATIARYYSKGVVISNVAPKRLGHARSGDRAVCNDMTPREAHDERAVDLRTAPTDAESYRPP